MTYLMVDISGRSPVYDIPLCEALHKVLPPEHRIKLLAPNISPKDVEFDCGRLFGFIPHRLQKSKRKPFRALKALMVVVKCSQSTMFTRTIAAKKKGKKKIKNSCNL